MRRFSTLRVRFALWTATFLITALVLSGLVVYINMSRSLVAAIDNTLELAVLQLLLEVEVERGELRLVENVPEYIESTRQLGYDISIRAFNSRGEKIQEYGPYTSLPIPIMSALSTNQRGVFSTVDYLNNQEPVRVYTSPIVEFGNLVGAIQVAQSLISTRRTLNLLALSLLVGAPLIAIVASVGGYFLAARALAPIEMITQTARNISAQDLSARLNIPDNDDEVGHLAATFDSMLERLEQAFHRERQFTADASHELRTPLSAMKTIIDSTLTRHRTPTEYEQSLYDLSNEADQMKALAEMLLDLARHDTDRNVSNFELIDLSTLLKDLLESVYPLAEEKNLQLIDKVPATRLNLQGDRDGLIRLFLNLLDNAVKYTNAGAVTVTAWQDDEQYLVAEISDTGIGISPDNVPHIFSRFYQADKARGESGVGLGLSIAQRIAQLHGGDITVESQRSKGTTFKVKLCCQNTA